MAAVDLGERLRRLGRAGAPPLAAAAQAGQAPREASLEDLIARIERLRRGARLRQQVPDDAGLARAAGGRLLAPGLVRVERRYPLWHRHGRQALAALAQLTRDAHGCLRHGEAIEPRRLLFIDTETTGLAGGSGTLAFMVGLGRLDENCFAVRQYLIERFDAEAAMLEHLRAEVRAGDTLVSFNGRSYDLPLLATRLRLARQPSPFEGLAHIDLLHALRRRHGATLPDCRLTTAETHVLRHARRDDLPGSLAPQAWQQLLKSGTTQAIEGVLRHNRDDVVAMAALLAALAAPEAALCRA